MQRMGRGVAGAISGAVIGAGSGLYTLRHAPVIAGDIVSSGFHQHRSGPLAQAPGNPITDGLRDCANAAVFATIGIPFTAICLAGQLVALPLLFAIGGAYEGAASGVGPCEITKDLVAGGCRYDDWWISSHEDFLRERAADKAYDAEHGRA